MSGVPVDVLDYYDEEVVRRIIEKYGYGEREALGLFLDSQTYRMVCLQIRRWRCGSSVQKESSTSGKVRRSRVRRRTRHI